MYLNDEPGAWQGSMCNKQISLHCIRPEISLCFDLQFILYVQSPFFCGKRGRESKGIVLRSRAKYLKKFSAIFMSSQQFSCVHP